MQAGYRSLFGLRVSSAVAVLTALTCAASDRDAVTLAEPNSSVSNFVPIRDPFSSGLPRQKTLKESSERPLAVVTDLQGKERKVEPKGKVIEVEVMLGDFWCPGEFERLCKQLRLERKVQSQRVD
jgi:hypothetical protein